MRHNAAYMVKWLLQCLFDSSGVCAQARSLDAGAHITRCDEYVCRIPHIQLPLSCPKNPRSQDGTLPGTCLLQIAGYSAHVLKQSSACIIHFFSSHSQAECAMGVCRFCSWPQELMLRLEGTADLHQIQILSHEYKVLLQYLPCLVLPEQAVPSSMISEPKHCPLS